MKANENTWFKDYAEFTLADKSNVSNELFIKIKDKLFPSPWKVFSKILSLHLVVGILSLTICTQFDLNPFATQHSLANWFIEIGGHHFCMVACGVFFMTSTYLLANSVMSLEEFEMIRRHQWLQSGALGLISLMAFYFFGAELILTLVGLWILGVFIGSYTTVECSYLFRRKWAN